jgi:Family of unknown function (DUF5677)
MQSASSEEESLKLVEDFLDALTRALKSLKGNAPPHKLLSNYRFWSAKHLHRAIAGFAFLRRSGRLDSSKFLVRPAIEMVIRLEAASKDPDLFYRIAFSEHRRDEQFLREVDKRLNNEAQSKENWKRFEANWERFRDAFTKEFPDIPKEDQPLTVASAAEKMGMENLYGGYYRIYSQYTHGALLASIGYLDQGTDPEDNRIMAMCAVGALDALISLGAESSKRDDLFRRFQRLFAKQLKGEVVQASSGNSPA